MPKTFKYGCIKNSLDHRDFKLERPQTAVELPPKFDLLATMPSVYDQENEGSCVLNAVGASIEHQLKTQKLMDFMPSRNFMYYNGRLLEGTVNEDSGLQIRDAIKAVVNQGVCDETLWPYNEEDMYKKPTDNCYTEALQNIVEQYNSVEQDLVALKTAIVQGFPVVCGIILYKTFESDEVESTGIVPMPKPHERCEGGHGVLMVGWDDSNNTFLVRNSWSSDWGQKGYFTLPYEYILNPELSSDFTIIQLVK